MSDTKQYLERLEGLTAGRDPLAIQEITAPAIATLIQYEPEARLQVRPGPNKIRCQNNRTPRR